MVPPGFLESRGIYCLSLQMTKAKFSDYRWTAGLVGPARPCSISFGYAEVPRRSCCAKLCRSKLLLALKAKTRTSTRFELADGNWTANNQGV